MLELLRIKLPYLGLSWMLLLLWQPALAQGVSSLNSNRSFLENPRVRAFTPSDYQAANQNWMLAQSSDGSIHVANSGGLLTFNGAFWQQRSLPGEKIVRSVAASADERIYVGAYNEFGYFSKDIKGESSYTSLSKDLPPSELGEEIWNIIVLDSLVVFHSFGAIYIFDGQSVQKQLPPGVILNMIPGDGQLLVPVIDGGLYAWQPNQAFTLLPGSEALAGKNIKGLISKHDTLLIATESSGIFRLQQGQLKPWKIPLSATLANDQINHFQQLSNGEIAVGTILGGLYLLHTDGTLDYRIDRNCGLQNNTIIAMMEDRMGNLWLGLDRGIDMLALSDPLRYFTANQQAIGNVYAATIFEDRLYLGTNQGLFQRLLTSHDPYQLVAGTQGQVWELTVVGKQLLCGHNNGTYLIHNQSASLLSSITGGWQLLPLSPQDTLLLQATYTGLIRLNRAQQQWTVSQPFAGLTVPLREIVRTDTFEFLAAHVAEGLYRLTLNADFSAFRKIEVMGQAQGLPAGHAFHLTALPEGVLVQTATQKYLYDGNDFVLIDTFRGQQLLSNAWVIPKTEEKWVQAAANHVWMYNSNEPILRFAVPLAHDHPKLISLSNGQTLFCLDEGYALLDDERLVERTPATPLYIHWEYYDQEDWQALPVEQLTLRSRQNQLRFSFHQPIFDQVGLYQYQLQGFDTEWSEWSAKFEKEYTNLPPGSYQFVVVSQLNGMRQTLAFSIKPPWYLSTWSYVIYALLTVFIGWSLYRWHQWRLNRQARALELKRQRELQHERIRLRNEQLQTDIIGKSKALANSTFNLVRKNEILLTLKEELKNAAQRSLSGHDHYKLKVLIDKHLSSKQDWEIFESNFNQVHDDFFKRLKAAYPDLTPGYLKLAAYLRMNLSSKEIAPLLHISIRGVENKRYRLRKKMELDADANLTSFFMDY